MKNVRRGLGKGLGCGYRNIVPIDAHIHSLSAKGKKTYAVPVKGLMYVKARDEGKAKKRLKELLENNAFTHYKPTLQYGAVDDQDPILELRDGDIDATEYNTLEAKGNVYDNVEKKDSGVRIVKGVNGYRIEDEKGKILFDKVFNDHLEAFAYYKQNRYTLKAKFSMYGQKWTVVDKNKRTVLLKTKKGDTLTITREEYEQYKPKRYSVQEMIESVVNAKGKKCDVVSHLKHSKLPDSKFDMVQLKKGMGVETEHTTSKKVAKAIAKAHLLENPDYYKRFNPKKKTKDYLVNAKGWKKRDARNTFADYYWTTPDTSLTISHTQDRDGKNAFVYYVTATKGLSSIGKYPSRLQKKVIWKGRSDKLAMQKAKEYMRSK